jgi:toxin ParE1/3/4
VNAAKGPWRVSLAAAADADFAEILYWTAERFGRAQAEAYAETLWAALDALTEGPSILGAKPRNDIAPGIHTLHVARSGRKGSHFVVFRPRRERGREVIQILRILHDAMDLHSHVP